MKGIVIFLSKSLSRDARVEELSRGEGEKLTYYRLRMRRSGRQEVGNTEKGEEQIWDDEGGVEIREKVINIKDRFLGREGNK